MKETNHILGCDLGNGLSITSTSSLTLASNNSAIVGGSTNSISIPTYNMNGYAYQYSNLNKIYILGDYIECFPLLTTNINIIATLNVLGEPYWIELKRLNGHMDLSPKVIKFIEKRIKIERRNKNIDIITNS